MSEFVPVTPMGEIPLRLPSDAGVAAPPKTVISVQSGIVALSMDSSKETVFTCRRCRFKLFDENDLSSHQSQQHSLSRHKLNKDSQQVQVGKGGHHATVASGQCSSFFLAETMNWMKLDGENQVEGKFLCPSCDTRLGSFSWMGAQCSCGTWVTPALQIPKSRVDRSYISKAAYDAWHAQLESEKQGSQQQGDSSASKENVFAESSELINQVPNQQATDETTIEETTKNEENTRVALHRSWVNGTVTGCVEELVSVLDSEECSLTTVRNKVLDGLAAVEKGLAAGAKSMKGRMQIHRGPVRLPSGATRVVMLLNPVNSAESPTYVGEAIWWSELDKVQHINRTVLKGDIDTTVEERIKKFLSL